MDKGWSINHKDWKALEQALPRGNSWNSVLLTPNDQSVVPESPGVYAICAQPPSIMGSDQCAIFQSLASPIYIGRSEFSIKSRFLAHCKNTDPKLRLAKHCYDKLQFWFIEISANAVKDAEAWLIKCFGPPANKVSGTITGTIKPQVEA